MNRFTELLKAYQEAVKAGRIEHDTAMRQLAQTYVVEKIIGCIDSIQ